MRVSAFLLLFFLPHLASAEVMEFLEFHTCYTTHSPCGDVNGDGSVTGSDFLLYRSQFITANTTPHPADGPRVISVGRVAPQVLSLRIEERTLIKAHQRDFTESQYELREETAGDAILALRNGAPVLTRGTKAHNLSNGAVEGWYIEGDQKVSVPMRNIGPRLDQGMIPKRYAYNLEGKVPTQVYRKSEPIGPDSLTAPAQHTVYLVLAEPLIDGVEYTLDLLGLSTAERTVSFIPGPLEPSEAIHVTQVGFRPDDPLKRAFLSLWMGDGGGVRWGELTTFHLIDANDTQVFTSAPVLAISEEQTETLYGGRNFTLADVWWLDFSAFMGTGVYRVQVPGVGTSQPFRIDADTWGDAYALSMQGWAAQRHTGVRPAYQLSIGLGQENQVLAVRDDLLAQMGPGMSLDNLTPVPDAWGGWKDAGDWDRNGLHLEAVLLLLEVYELYGSPGALEEAIWGLDLFVRLQREDGAVRGGIESTEHPRFGELSTQETLMLGVFAPDVRTTLVFAAAAAYAGRVTGNAVYLDAAERAWAWAEASPEAASPNISVASVFLYWATGNPVYHARFLASAVPEGIYLNNQHTLAAFTYARMPAEWVDTTKQTGLSRAITSMADKALQMGEGNGFNISIHNPFLPMIGWVGYWSTPESAIGPMLPRAFHLTGEEKYLRGAIAAAQYNAGAGPSNTTMVTGLGHTSPEWPLHVDTLISGNPPPPGITIYGPRDPTYGVPWWVGVWFYRDLLYPEHTAWPAAEFHVDIPAWAEMSEYTVHQILPRTTYYMAFLAGRE